MPNFMKEGMRDVELEDPALDFRMCELTIAKMWDEIELNPVSGVVALVNAEVAAAWVIVQQDDAGEATLVVKRDMRDGGLDTLLNRIHAAKRLIRFIQKPLNMHENK
jgi:hypothetical protein